MSTVSLAVMAAAPAAAQSWIGTTPDWNNTANWSTGVVPAGVGTTIVAAGGTVFPTLSGIAANVNNLQLGAAGSTASLALSAGASLSAYSIVIGQAAGQTGVLQVAGPTTKLTGSFLSLGFNGTGTLLLTDGATANFSETVTSANFAGSVSTMTLSGANTSYYARNGHGIGVSGDGTISILAGARADDSGVTLAQNAGSRGTATVSGNGSAWNIRAALVVGSQGTANFGISDGARVAVAFNTLVGHQAAGKGTLTLDGAGSRLDTSGYTVLGNYGQGSAVISGGAVHQTNQGIMGWYAGSRGDLTVSGENSLWLGTTYLMVGNLGSAEATFANGGTVRMTASTGQISIANGAGSTGTVNIGAAQGAAPQAPGFMQVGTIRFGSGTGKLVFNHTASGYAVDAAIVGKGTVITENGTTILQGANTYTGATEVRGGTLVVNSTIASSSGLTVAAGGTVSGTGTLPSMTVNGTLSPGNSPGTMTINGNLTLGPTAVYLAELQGAVADRVNVNGTAALAGTLRVVSLGGAYQFYSPYTLLSATGGRSGSFSQVDATGAFGAAVGTAVNYTATDVQLSLTPKPLVPIVAPAPGVVSSVNAFSVASAIDAAVANGGNPSSLFAIYNLPAAAIPAAVNTLSGEVHTAAPAMANVVSDQFLRTMLDPTAAGRLGAGSAGPASAAFSGLVRKGADQPVEPSRLDAPFYSVWGSAYGSYGRTDGAARMGSASRSIDDAHLATGVDVRLMPGTVAGIAVSGGTARASLPGVLGKIDADVFQAGLYGATQLGPVKLGGALSYARLENDVSRGIPAVGSSLSSSYATTAWSGRLQASTALLSWNGLAVSPLAALQATHARSPAVIEANWIGGNAGALALNKRNDVTARSELGAQFDADAVLGSVPVTGYVRAAWAHYFQRDADLTASLIGLPGASFAATGAEADRNSALLSAGLKAKLSERISLGLNIDGELSGNSNRLGGSAQLKVSF
ncbi:autotransporter outer membrane beta-barrel domain-containing protein [Bosea sp. (in: a-proteobacteria)]|uniref:autotransporter outer membrane beta-barrel domain-containing protein n=1 Tax=Bosea sp. (in: a-proteobacteria) TaxID=1871050 RepID=UPI002E1684BD